MEGIYLAVAVVKVSFALKNALASLSCFVFSATKRFVYLCYIMHIY